MQDFSISFISAQHSSALQDRVLQYAFGCITEVELCNAVQCCKGHEWPCSSSSPVQWSVQFSIWRKFRNVHPGVTCGTTSENGRQCSASSLPHLLLELRYPRGETRLVYISLYAHTSFRRNKSFSAVSRIFF